MDAGELFVRVRPNTAGFAEEATPGVQAAGIGLGKVFVAAFSVVAIGDVVKHAVQAAVQQQATFATLNKVVSNAGAANTVHSDTVDNLVKQQAALRGFSVADVAGAFTKLVSVTRDSAQAFRLLSVAQDLARGTGKNLGVSALAVDKAFQGSFTSLSRYGIIVHPVTTAVTALKDAHTKAADAGAKFTAEENQAYAAAIKAATAQDKILTGQAAILAIQQRFGGSAATFAHTAAGEYDRLKVSVHELEVTFGSALLPTITAGVTDLSRWVDSLTKSRSVTDAAKTAAHDFSVGLHDVEGAVKAVGPPLLQVAKTVEQVVSAIGAPALLAAAGTYEAIKLAAAGWGAAQGVVNGIIAAGQPARVAEITQTQALTAALVENTAALRGQFVAASADQLAIDGLAASEVAAGAAGAAGATGLVAFRDGLLAIAASPAGIVIGIAAAVAAIVTLSGHEQTWSDLNNAVTGSVNNLNAALAQQKTAASAASAAAAAAVQAARDQLASSVAKESSTAQSAISVFGHAKEIQDQWTLSIDKQREAIAKSDPVLSHNLGLIEQLSSDIHAIPSTVDIQLLINNQDPTAGLAAILSGFTRVTTAFEQAGHLITAGARVPILLGALTDIGKTITAGAQKGAADALADAKSGKTHDLLTAAAKAQILSLQQGIDLSKGQLADLYQQLADAVQQGAIAVANAVQQGKQNLNTIGQDIASSIGTYIDTPLTLASNALQLHADRITATYAGLNASLDQQTQAIQAKADRTAATYAGLNATLDRQTGRIGLRADKLSLHELATSIALPGGQALSSNAATAVRQLEQLKSHASAAGKFALQAFIDQYQTAVIKVKKDQIAIAEAVTPKTAVASAGIRVAKDRIAAAELVTPLEAARAAGLRVSQDIATQTKIDTAKALADITDLFNKKKIQWGTLSADVAGILRRDHVNFGEAGRVDGAAFVDRFVGELAGLRQQSLANAAGPQQPGTGLLPSIVHPLTTQENTTKTIAGIAHSIATNQLSELKAHTKILTLIHGAQKGATATSLFKNPGDATKRTAALTGVTG